MSRADEVNALASSCANAQKDRTKRIGSLKKDTHALLAECKAEDKSRAQYIENLKQDTQLLIKAAHQENKHHAQEVAGMLGDFHKEHLATASAFRGLLKTMSGLRCPAPITDGAHTDGDKKPTRKRKK